MPNYDFICALCGHGFEKLCPMAERDNGIPCPVCGGEARRRPVNGFASAVKGQAPPCGASGGCGGRCPHSH